MNQPVPDPAPAHPNTALAMGEASTQSLPGHPAPGQYLMAGRGQVGKIRGTGVCILLSIVTLGIYQLVYFYKVHSEMKRHSGNGIDGGLALVLAIFLGIVMPYLTASEVGNLYRCRGLTRPVSGVTGLWYFPGMFIVVGPLIWFVKMNGALNNYWRSLGAA